MRFTRSSTESAAHATCAARAASTTAGTFDAGVLSDMRAAAYSHPAPAVRSGSIAMSRRLVLLLVPVAALGACSRGVVPDDPAPSALASSTGIPPAASGARIERVDGPSNAAGDAGAATAFPTGSPPSGSPSHAVHLRDAGVTLSSAGLPPEVVRRIVRQNFGRLRLCYENGLRSDPSLAGSVRIRFVIRADGSAGSATDSGSSLADRAVVECIRHAFEMLSFPSPTPATALVATYSVSLSPPDP